MLSDEGHFPKRSLQQTSKLVNESRCYLLQFKGKNKLGMYSDEVQYI